MGVLPLLIPDKKFERTIMTETPALMPEPESSNLVKRTVYDASSRPAAAQNLDHFPSQLRRQQAASAWGCQQ
jgi:hypothetical protein